VTAWLVVGLGNPGPRYERTRHNVGARVVQLLAERLGTRLRKVRFLPIEAGEARVGDAPALLARPQTFMNVSGPPLSSLAKRRRIDPGRVVVCHDEIDLRLGSVKVKLGGSAAGHRGVESLVGAFRSPDFYRVRLGVGRPPGRKDAADHVLDRFARAEEEEAGLLVEEGADAVLTLIREGLAVAQDRHNRTAPQR
jgi:peptidyl-tRNA hydrolase, PTH1 family